MGSVTPYAEFIARRFPHRPPAELPGFRTGDRVQVVGFGVATVVAVVTNRANGYIPRYLVQAMTGGTRRYFSAEDLTLYSRDDEAEQ